MGKLVIPEANGDFKTSTILYDVLAPRMQEIAKDDKKLKELVKIIKFITDKNTDVLNTNIVGRPLLLNDKDQDDIYKILEISKKDLHTLCLSSPRLIGIGKIINQFSFALPLLILSGELHKLKKEQLAQGVFLFTYYRPYASKVTTFFRLGIVDEKAMEYTTMIELNNKSFIHKYGSVYAVLTESAKSAYTSFIDNLSGIPTAPTDDILFNNIFYSAIFGKTGSWLKSLYGAYITVKKSGKALDYEQSFFSSYDDDSGKDSIEDNNINSNSAAKRNIVSPAISRFNTSPINNTYINFAATYGNGSPSRLYESFLKQMISNIVNTRVEQVPVLFDAIVGAFLDTLDDNGNRNLPSEIGTSKFVAYSKKIFKTSHTNNSNIREEQNILEDLLVSFSPKYITSDVKTKRKMKLALYMYFVLFINK